MLLSVSFQFQISIFCVCKSFEKNEKPSTIETINLTATAVDEADTFLQFEEKTDEKADQYKEEELHVISEEIEI